MHSAEHITVAAGRALAGVSAVTIYAWLKRGEVEGKREGRNVWVDKASLLKRAQNGSAEPDELDRARAIVTGETDEEPLTTDANEDEPAEEPVPEHLDGLDEETQQDFKVRMARRLVNQAGLMRKRRRREAELELLWMAVQELGFADAEISAVKGEQDAVF